ncbi:MAG: thiol:disulfide interchange protein DsbA/DsbL [Gammaproteobacteria bacterium]|jgi:thiol:disulfide interchange protein DsbA|nr:thiol:disulfide interchange protein DsbA/DsbL [Gammaproteobacteria bacterium]MDH3751045.1 thiol:disulfide interchange protein DsbA/DsbL [Gammaproteobacteria bacterium]MDH3804736.1 thiol:disulfide interchange protein DsbA/DsbL [Gammaproteobacteria bacterium]
MKHTLLLSLLCLFLVACGTEEAAAPAADEQPTVAEPLVDEVDAAQEATEADTVDETIEVVEESAAEPEADEQAILLAQADAPTAAREWQFKEGQNYIRLVPAQPTVGGADKIEVAEFFYYMCPHCYNFEPAIKGWAENKPANVRFVQVPATWNAFLILHARMYYTNEILARNGVIADGAAFHDAVYEEIHRRNNRLSSEGAIQKLFERFGVSAEDFSRTWKSFEVDQKLRVAQDLARRYSIASTPMIVVNGKYRSGAKEAGSYPKLIELIDELIVRESAR